jgi:hypothetical protein
MPVSLVAASGTSADVEGGRGAVPRIAASFFVFFGLVKSGLVLGVVPGGTDVAEPVPKTTQTLAGGSPGDATARGLTPWTRWLLVCVLFPAAVERSGGSTGTPGAGGAEAREGADWGGATGNPLAGCFGRSTVAIGRCVEARRRGGEKMIGYRA